MFFLFVFSLGMIESIAEASHYVVWKCKVQNIYSMSSEDEAPYVLYTLECDGKIHHFRNYLDGHVDTNSRDTDDIPNDSNADKLDNAFIKDAEVTVKVLQSMITEKIHGVE